MRIPGLEVAEGFRPTTEGAGKVRTAKTTHESMTSSLDALESVYTGSGTNMVGDDSNKQAALVESRKQGLFVHYRLADPEVFELSKVIRSVAARRLADFDRVVREHFSGRDEGDAVGVDELLKLARSKKVVIVDTRPASEYASGHIAGALSVPVDELHRRLKELPKSKNYVAYCRGPYCVYADRAVEILRSSGRRARRLVEGFPEWRLAGLPVSDGGAPGPLM